MNRGCLALSGLGLISLFVFGVTLEAVNDPKELRAIPFTLCDFITYGLIAFAIQMLVRLTRKRDPGKTLTGKWTSDVTRDGTRYRSALSLDPDGSAEIYTKQKVDGFVQRLRITAQWQLLDDKTLYLSGNHAVTCKILKIKSWSMTMAIPAHSGYSIRWIKHPKINSKACFLVASAILLPILLGLSLPHSRQSHAIAEDPQSVPPNASGHDH
jgi:hypothetical protein